MRLSNGRVVDSSEPSSGTPDALRRATLPFPSSIALYRQPGTVRKQLAVVDRLNHRVVLFDPTTLYPQTAIGARGEAGSAPDHFCRPSDVAEFNGRLYITDLGNHRVSCFALRTPPHAPRHVTCFGSHGTAAGQFAAPCGIDILCEKADVMREGVSARLVVSEYEGRRVQVLTLSGTPLQLVRPPARGALVGLCVSGLHVYVADAERGLLAMQLPRGSSHLQPPASCGAIDGSKRPAGCPRAALPFCAKCGAVRVLGGSSLARCPCRACCYCDASCQRQDWARHKSEHRFSMLERQRAAVTHDTAPGTGSVARGVEG